MPRELLNMTREHLEEKIFLDFKVLLITKNTFFMRRAWRNVMQEAGDNSIDYLPILARAMQAERIISMEGIAPVEVGLCTEETTNKTALKCRLCNKVFENGENGWRGYQRKCKQNCTIKDLYR